MEEGRITYSSMRAYIRKVEWISVEGKVPPGRREFMPVEVPLVTVEAGSPFRKIGEEVTYYMTRQNPNIEKGSAEDVDALHRKLDFLHDTDYQ